ncbi:MAG: hypothetical protein QM739_13860 [Propionivibrio sp.]
MSVVTKQSVLRVLHEEFCLDTRRLSHVLGVDTNDEALCKSVQDLLREGRIHRVGRSGRRSWFLATSFDR